MQRRTVTIYLEDDLARWVRAQAAAHGRSLSGYVRWILLGIRVRTAEPAVADTPPPPILPGNADRDRDRVRT